MTTVSTGQPIHFWPGSLEVGQTRMNSQQPQPFHAVVVFVQSDETVNLAGYDHIGKPFNRERCRLLQEGEDRPAGGISYATWPATKTAAADVLASQVFGR